MGTQGYARVWGALTTSLTTSLTLTLVGAASTLTLTSGCLATRNLDTAPAGSEPSKMLDKTAVGKNRCDAGDANFAPFVVEWDATDLSTFEAKAARDVVFVRYKDCQIELLYSCSDNGIPGRYGRYQEPTFTSGTVESIEIKNEDELYAKLPLGAVSFGANVKMGEALELQYFVSGVVTSTRNSISRAALQDNPRCEGATHFVSAYNLGAFQLMAYKGATGQAGLEVKTAGGGARSTSESENLKQGGALESCETQSQRKCRVPIRLVLQTIDEASQDLDASAPVAAPSAPAVTNYEDRPESRARALRDTARKKEAAGDGQGCLDDLERADRLDPSGGGDKSLAYTRGLCMMRAGQCDEGKAMMRDYLAALDDKHRKTDKQLDKQVESMARGKCNLAQQKDVEGKVTRIYTAIGEAQGKGNAEACIAMAREGEALAARVPKQDVQKFNQAAGTVMQAAGCLIKLERCDEGRRWWMRYYDLAFSHTMSKAEVRSAAEQTFAAHARECSS